MQNLSKKVLVTGADGFIGSHLVEQLLAQGYKVRALVFYNSFNSWGHLDGLELIEKIEVVSGDIRDPFFCNEICKGVDFVMHLAALIGIPYSYLAPQSYVETNVGGTVNMLKAAENNKIEKFIHTSTSEVYGTALTVPISESHALQPQSPYSASKISADMMALSFYNSFDLPVAVARPFNTYGPRQSARAVIPTIIMQLASGIKNVKLGATAPTRDFNYVTDTADAFIKILECEQSTGRVLNIGSGTEISIMDTFLKIKNFMNVEASIEQSNDRLRPDNSEVQRLCCDNSLLKSLTGYQPLVGFEQGLKNTIEWFSKSENLKKYKVGQYNV